MSPSVRLFQKLLISKQPVHCRVILNKTKFSTLSKVLDFLNNNCLWDIEGDESDLNTSHMLSCKRLYSSTKEDLKSNDVQQLLDNATTFENGNEDENLWATSPYPKGTFDHRLQSRHALRPRIDPRETSLILFPGEGSQYVGMGGQLLQFPGVKDVFSVANEILNYDLLALCLQGPKSTLDETKHAQVAVVVCSFAALEKLKEERRGSVEKCMATAGFGVGELTALTFAGVLSFERAVRLAQLRGEAMQTASEMEPSGMLTLMFDASTKLHEILTRAKEHAASQGVGNPVCEVAHYLFPHCKVVAGHIQCLEYIEKNYMQLKLKKVRRLNIAGAHHTSLMAPAAFPFKQFLTRSNLQDPVIAVHSTADGKIYRNKEEIARNLPKQMVKPVKWEQLMHVLYERPMGKHFPSTFEVGPGNTLKTVLKMVNAKAYDSCYNVFDKPSV